MYLQPVLRVALQYQEDTKQRNHSPRIPYLVNNGAATSLKCPSLCGSMLEPRSTTSAISVAKRPPGHPASAVVFLGCDLHGRSKEWRDQRQTSSVVADRQVTDSNYIDILGAEATTQNQPTFTTKRCGLRPRPPRFPSYSCLRRSTGTAQRPEIHVAWQSDAAYLRISTPF